VECVSRSFMRMGGLKKERGWTRTRGKEDTKLFLYFEPNNK